MRTSRFRKELSRSAALVVLALALLGYGCEADDIVAEGPLGTVVVVTESTGTNVDRDGYQLRLTGPSFDDTRNIPADDSSGFTVLSGQDYTATLSGIAANCSVDVNPQTVTAVTYRVVTIRFNVPCR